MDNDYSFNLTLLLRFVCFGVGLLLSALCLATHAVGRIGRIEDAVEDHFGVPLLDPESHLALKCKRAPLVSIHTEGTYLRTSASDSALCSSPALKQHVWMTPELRRRKQKTI